SRVPDGQNRRFSKSLRILRIAFFLFRNHLETAQREQAQKLVWAGSASGSTLFGNRRSPQPGGRAPARDFRKVRLRGLQGRVAETDRRSNLRSQWPPLALRQHYRSRQKRQPRTLLPPWPAG